VARKPVVGLAGSGTTQPDLVSIVGATPSAGRLSDVVHRQSRSSNLGQYSGEGSAMQCDSELPGVLGSTDVDPAYVAAGLDGMWSDGDRTAHHWGIRTISVPWLKQCERTERPGRTRAEALSALVSSYPMWALQPHMRADASDYVIRAKIEKLIDVIPNTSTPGYPFQCTGASTNEKLKLRYREEIIQAVMKVFKFYRSCTPEEFRSNPLKKLQDGLRYPYIFSVKKEAHKREKVKSEKWRIIIPSGIVNQLVERMIICGFQTSLDENYGKTQQATKIGFDDEGHQIVGRMYEEKTKLHGFPGVGSDATGWDVSVCEVGHYTFGDLLVSTCIGSKQDILNYQQIVRSMCLENSDPLFVIDGAVVKQVYPGKVHSGCYVTTPGNGAQRGYLVHKSGGTWSITRGDDCVEWNSVFSNYEDLTKYYVNNMGLKARDVKKFTEDSFEICSHKYQRGRDGVWTASLTSWRKSVVTFLVKKSANWSDLKQLLHEMRHNDPLERWIAQHVGALHVNTVGPRR